MSREIRAVRELMPQSDGDTIHLRDFQMYRNGKLYGSWKPAKKSMTSKGLLKIRLLGIDSPEIHYHGPQKKDCPATYLSAQSGRRPKIPPQEPWGSAAKDWLDRHLADGSRVIVELDREITDKYSRILGYVWTVRGNWQKGDLLNARLVREGLAFPYQIWPNLEAQRHGPLGRLETSLMLYLAPELVDLTAVPDGFRSDQLHHSRFISGEGITRYVNIKEHSEIGVDGFPAEASAKDGELFYQSVLTALEKVVRELQQEA